jgi:DNA-binding CsgD family transcriptional regulator
MDGATETSQALQEVETLARECAALGVELGLPYIAASPDIASTDPIVGPDGRPFAETLFRWVDPDLRYWEDRGFALKVACVHAARACAEPFYFADGRFASWRRNRALEAINEERPIDAMGVGAAIIAPAYLPGDVIGAICWASKDPDAPAAALFAVHAEHLQAVALKLFATYAEAMAGRAEAPARLTRREIQCLKWAAAGKTDQEIGELVHISAPTVRFHINNASRKLHVTGRSQAVRRAATLGYIGAGRVAGPPS